MSVERILENIDGKGMKYLRNQTGLTPVRFAWEIGASYTAIYSWEKGQHKPSSLARQLIAKRYAKIIAKDKFFKKYE